MRLTLALAYLFLFAQTTFAMPPIDCAQSIDRDTVAKGGSVRWTFPSVAPDVMAGATRLGKNPLVTVGDFDDDGHDDVAFLIKSASGKPRIAACLSGEPSKVRYIDNPYCADGIATAGKGAAYYDYETGKSGHYPSAGISAYCYGKAGATYIWWNGSFRQVIDSD